jgi:di/tripeptidase
MMMVAKYVFANKLQSDKGILFVANSCEEGLGNLKGGRQIMKDYAGRVTEFYTFDGGYAHIVNKCVGSHRYQIDFTSKGGHSFGAFGNTNAIAVMSQLITELYKCQVPVKEGTKTTYNVGLVEGGTSVNTIAQSSKMLFEYRSDDLDCLAQMQKFFNDTVKKVQANTDAQIKVELIGERPCGGKVDQAKLDQMTNDIIEICEKYSGEPCAINSGSTDCNIPMSLGVPAVCVGSHKSWGAHKREEYIYLSSLPIGYKITAETILRFFK